MCHTACPSGCPGSKPNEVWLLRLLYIQTLKRRESYSAIHKICILFFRKVNKVRWYHGHRIMIVCRATERSIFIKQHETARCKACERGANRTMKSSASTPFSCCNVMSLYKRRNRFPQRMCFAKSENIPFMRLVC